MSALTWRHENGVVCASGVRKVGEQFFCSQHGEHVHYEEPPYEAANVSLNNAIEDVLTAACVKQVAEAIKPRVEVNYREVIVAWYNPGNGKIGHKEKPGRVPLFWKRPVDWTWTAPRAPDAPDLGGPGPDLEWLLSTMGHVKLEVSLIDGSPPFIGVLMATETTEMDAHLTFLRADLPIDTMETRSVAFSNVRLAEPVGEVGL